MSDTDAQEEVEIALARVALVIGRYGQMAQVVGAWPPEEHARVSDALKLIAEAARTGAILNRHRAEALGESPGPLVDGVAAALADAPPDRPDVIIPARSARRRTDRAVDKARKKATPRLGGGADKPEATRRTGAPARKRGAA